MARPSVSITSNILERSELTSAAFVSSALVSSAFVSSALVSSAFVSSALVVSAAAGAAVVSAGFPCPQPAIDATIAADIAVHISFLSLIVFISL